MNDMETLFDRLKPDIKEQLILQEPLFPTLCGDLIKLLKENVAVTAITLGDLSNLSNFKEGYTTQISEFYDMFND